MDKKLRIEQLIEQLNTANIQYYDLDNPTLTDKEYDNLFDELVQLEKETNYILDKSPTQKVKPEYEKLTELKKVTHDQPTLSLQKTKSVDELISFSIDKEVILSWKLDGLTVVLTYDNGKLVQGATRGTGIIGEDITHNVRVFDNVPLEIGYKDKITVRGEAIITYSDFHKINEQIEQEQLEKGKKEEDIQLYKNPRNLCSGSVRQLDSKIAKQRSIKFIAFDLANIEGDFKTKSEKLTFLQKNNFDVVEHFVLRSSEIFNKVEYFKNQVDKIGYATDGLVLTYDDIRFSQSLGRTGKFPKDSIAFKWGDDAVETKLTNVIWNTSRTGTINPIAVFEPVEIDGTTVEKASLHNLSIFESFKFGIGDTITVYKANMIIPQIYKNLDKTNTLESPTKCPTCGNDTKIIEQSTVKTLHCINDNCSAKLMYKLSHFVSRDAMNIEGLSKATINKFIDLGYIYNFSSIYNLKKAKNDIISLNGFGEKSYTKLISNIEKSKTTKLSNFINAIGINNVGLETAQIIVKEANIKSIEEFLNLNIDVLSDIHGLGEITSKSIITYINNEVNRAELLNLSEILMIEKQSESNDTILDGKVFVVTGSVEQFKNRKELQGKIEELGGKVNGNVSTNTDYLINNDNTSSSNKNKKAQSLNIPIITEQEFLELIK